MSVKEVSSGSSYIAILGRNPLEFSTQTTVMSSENNDSFISSFPILIPFIISFFFKDFIYLFDGERESQREREHRHGEWERKKQAPSGGARCGARSQDSQITP